VSSALVQVLVLGGAGGSSSLAASLAKMAEEVEKWINATAANGVWWGVRSMLVLLEGTKETGEKTLDGGEPNPNTPPPPRVSRYGLDGLPRAWHPWLGSLPANMLRDGAGGSDSLSGLCCLHHVIGLYGFHHCGGEGPMLLLGLLVHRPALLGFPPRRVGLILTVRRAHLYS
jgi:hypothetical protein